MQQENTVIERAEAAFARGNAREAERLLAENAHASECAARLRDFLLTEGRLDEALALAAGHDDPVDRALQAHAAGDFRRAAELCRQRLSRQPDDPAALLHLARAVHNLGDAHEALQTLERLTRVAPGFAEGWYALAHALRAGGELERAVDAYERAIERSPALAAARFNLALTCLNADRPRRALECLEALMASDPENAEVLVHAGLAEHMLGRVEAARRRFERALSIAPGHAEAHRLLAAVFNESGRAVQAREHLERALASRPDDPELLADLADVHELSSELDAVASTLARGLEADPNHPRLLVARARLERRRGQCRDAVATLGRLDPQRLPPRLAMQYFHEFGLTLDRLEQPDQAMQAFETANRISAGDPRARSVDRQTFFARVEAIGSWLDQSPAGAGDPETGGGDDGRDLCFLIGFPRSGTTLIDTIVDASESVASIEERPTLEPVVERIAGLPGGYPAALDTLGAADLERLRRAYRQHAAPWIGDRSPELIVDKLPLRLLDVALIRRLFPAARLLFVERHPCDVVLSNFMQLYEPTPAFVNCYSLADTVGFYDAVMSLWARLAPIAGDALHALRYESVVSDPETTLQAVCDHLGIAWDAAMLDPQQRLRGRSRVRTTSYQQVGESIYDRASGRWKRYRQYLAPHLATLAPHAERLGYRLD